MTSPSRRLGAGFWSFVLLMTALTALFVVLGVWQVERLQWKEALIADVAARSNAAPTALSAADQWGTLDVSATAFAPVTVSGTWTRDKTVFVFTSLSEPKGQSGGAGYWVMTPLMVTGGSVFINRGFVPQAERDRFASGADLPTGTVTLSGVLVAPEAVGAFTPAADPKQKLEWVRDPVRLAALAGVSGPVLGATIDLPAGAPGTLPQGGETLVEFPNNHLGYALTWFGFALLTPALLAVWIRQRLRARRAAAG